MSVVDKAEWKAWSLISGSAFNKGGTAAPRPFYNDIEGWGVFFIHHHTLLQSKYNQGLVTQGARGTENRQLI